MVFRWLCWHKPIFMKNIWQKQYSQFPYVHDLGKPWWGVAYSVYIMCDQSLSDLCQGDPVARHRHVVIGWSLALSTGAVQSCLCSLNHIMICLQHLAELAVSNLGQLLFCLSITWSRCRNAYRDLWIMTIWPVAGLDGHNLINGPVVKLTSSISRLSTGGIVSLTARNITEFV